MCVCTGMHILLCDCLCLKYFTSEVHCRHFFFACSVSQSWLDLDSRRTQRTHQKDKQNKMCLAGMNYIMSLASSPSSPLTYTCTHTHWYLRGFPVMEDTHPCSHILLKTLFLCIMFSLTFPSLSHCWRATVYGYCEDSVSMEMFCLSYTICPLSQKSSHCIQLAVSPWRVYA